MTGSSPNLVFIGTSEDTPHIAALKTALKGAKCFNVASSQVLTLKQLELYAAEPHRSITGVLSTSVDLLSKLTGKKSPSLDAYSGSYFLRNGLEYVFINPLEHTVTVPYGKFLLERYASKLVNPAVWLQAPEFKWRILNHSNIQEAYDFLCSSYVVAIDIETFKENLAIRCIGYTGIRDTGGGFESYSYVLPIDSVWSLEWMRKLNATPPAKIFQNGKYDVAYLSRYNAVPYNYLWDTANLMHSWYSELPKDLAFLQSFFVREAAYWKDLAESNDLETYYLYNAKDTWATACAFLAWMMQAPEWAHKNYQLEFPLTFPCHLSEMTGIKRDISALSSARKEVDNMIDAKNLSLRTMLGSPNFNVNSPVQMKNLLRVLGDPMPQSADAKALAKAITKHPLNARIIRLITGVPKTDNMELMGIRSMRKAKSTYLRTEEDEDDKGEGGAKELNGRILYALNPHGTDSGRLASREHHFWCGLQIQNIPSGKTIKQTIVSDDGFYLGECDLEQAETRDVAYITGDLNLIAAVCSTRDFHSHNTSAFFGVPYETVYDDDKKKTLNKPLRDLAKRVNHGVNYNMGAWMLVETMGEEKIFEASNLLGLKKGMTAVEIAEYLLRQFDKTYPTIRGDYQVWIISQVLTHKKFVGVTGWTRYCFSNPKTSKPALNTYISHPSQSLNAMVLNQAYMKVFYDIALHPEYKHNFKLCAQIHDSILFQYREGHEYLADMVKERMEIPVTIKDIKGIERTFTVPAALKLGKTDKDGNFIRAQRWSETE